MRMILVLMATTALAACSGGSGTQSASGVPVTGGGTTGGGGTLPHTFVAPTVTKTYSAQGALHVYKYDYQETLSYQKVAQKDANGNVIKDANGFPIMVVDPNSRTLTGTTQANQLYTANAATVRNPGIQVTYDPRNAQFTLAINQGSAVDNITFQDPLHRTDFSGLRKPQSGVPNLEIPNQPDWRTRGVQYLEAVTGSSKTVYDVSTFFYELPGTKTNYVTYAGFVRNHGENIDQPVETVDQDTATSQVRTATLSTRIEHAAFVYGELTPDSAVPKSGSATYSGNMTASMVNNPSFDKTLDPATYFQWIQGTANVSVNFGTGNVTTSLTGVTQAAALDGSPLIDPTNTLGFPYQTAFLGAGAVFSAAGTGKIDLISTGGFTGTFNTASFVSGGVTTPLSIVGSSLDGAFYGPKADEVGASFRIVGGIPDQRVDIVGSFTGKGNSQERIQCGIVWRLHLRRPQPFRLRRFWPSLWPRIVRRAAPSR
jgi:C-lobe and N-lobe beta barrels of Tf-binding protein B